jgi:2-dehydro-3-deoxy-D-arabinonate dehydratase
VHIARYRESSTAQLSVGVVADGRVTPLKNCSSIAELLGWRLEVIRERCEAADSSATSLAGVEIAAPIDGFTEVWAAGVTYLWSREARAKESTEFARAYNLVYDAPRPELFFKSAAWRVVGTGGPVAIRADSTIDVPEPELALFVNRYGEIVGYTICNDMSSRSIEGENPLYLPQAKVYLGGCAIGPMIRPAWEITDPYELAITVRISRAGHVVWSGEASTSQLRRRFDELVEYLFRADEFPFGVILSTGTCLVPELPFTLEAGDQVNITVSGVGALENVVVRGKDALAASLATALPRDATTATIK